MNNCIIITNDCGATSGHFMNHTIRIAEKKETRWFAHNSHTSMNVCSRHEINKLTPTTPPPPPPPSICAENGCLRECVYLCCISLNLYVCVHFIQFICVSNCTALRALMM